MPTATHPAADAGVLAVGDTRRIRLGRSVVATLVAGALFLAFLYLGKETDGLYSHSPWHDDPYDAVVSFAIFFTPVLAGLCLLRVPLCRRREPLPLGRAVSLLRGSRLTVGTMLVTLASDWIAVALRANQSQWDTTTGWLVVALAAATVVAAAAGVGLLGLSSPQRHGRLPSASDPDWCADIVTVAKQLTHLLGPLRPQAIRVLRWVDAPLLTIARRHAVVTAAALSAACGAAIAGNHAVGEGGQPAGAVLFFTIGASGMFVFLIVAGAYLDLLRAPIHIVGAARRMLDALVAGCVVVDLALAFRDSVGWMAGTSKIGGGPSWLLTTLAMVGVATFLVVFVGETALRAHHSSGEPALECASASTPPIPAGGPPLDPS